MFKVDVTEIIHEYEQKQELLPQDIIKCYLRMYQKAGFVGYDKKTKYEELSPGDVIFINGCFYPLTCNPVIDETLEHECIHQIESRRYKIKGSFGTTTKTCPYNCKKWVLAYKNDKGRIKNYTGDYEGMTTIKRDHISKVIDLFGKHQHFSKMKQHFLSLHETG